MSTAVTGRGSTGSRPTAERKELTEPKLYRTTFSQSRAAEYLDLGALQKLTGRPADDFPRVVVKELLDNALDAAETAGVAVPYVCVRGWRDGGFLVLEVHDNGVGIPAGVVERALDFSTLTSDKALYRTPTRGQQGNALKTIFGMPYALGDSDPRIWIDSDAAALPQRHSIAVRLGADEQGEIGHKIAPLIGDGTPVGTRITVRLPERRLHSTDCFSEPIADLVRAYHLFNPHAKVRFSWFGSDHDHGESGDTRTPEIEETHHPSVLSALYKKFRPDDLLVVHWYDVRSFARLIRSYVSHGEDMPLGEFLAKFRGFTSRPKASAARRAVEDARKLSDLSDEDVAALFGAMCSQVKAPSHAVLGDPLGEDHLVGALRNLYGSEPGKRVFYKRIKTSLNGTPAVVEAAVIETSSADEGTGLIVGLNHAPTYTDPLADAHISNETSSASVGGRGIWGFLRDARVASWDFMSGVCVAVHIMAASPATTDQGKTRLADDPVFQGDLGKALWSVSKVLYKEAKKRERDALAGF